MQNSLTPVGDPSREAIASLQGYVYQIYQAALAWIELEAGEFLCLEIAEDFAVVAKDALNAVQVKNTQNSVTLNSADIVACIDSYVDLKSKNPTMKVSLRYLTTSQIGKEQKLESRVDDFPMLEKWRQVAKTGDLTPFRVVLSRSNLSTKTKEFLGKLSDDEFRDDFLKSIHFDCGALDSAFLKRQIESKVSTLLRERGGTHSQTQSCVASIFMYLLELSTSKNKQDRIIDLSPLEVLLEAASRVSIPQAQFDAQNQMVLQAFSRAIPGGLSISAQPAKLPIVDMPLPKGLAPREATISAILNSLAGYGICWLSGAAGMGKTVAARLAALDTKGSWASINLRANDSTQVASELTRLANTVASSDLHGLIVDDLEWIDEPSVVDGLSYLYHAAARSDVLLIVTASGAPSADFLFLSGLAQAIVTKVAEFQEDDIVAILESLGVNAEVWAKYVHIVSGGGHPQLARAFIQSMAETGWNTEEFKTLNAILVGSPAIEDVRKRTRERLLRDLSSEKRRLLERLSLKIGSFRRELALDLAKLEPTISDAGVLLDALVGSWLDQVDTDRFSLSPLLSNYAKASISNEESATIEYAIAGSLTKKSNLYSHEMDAAFIAARNGGNTKAIVRILMAVLGADGDALEKLAPQLSVIQLISTDVVAFPSDPFVNHMFRGTQLLLRSIPGDDSAKLLDSLRCFERESGMFDANSATEAMKLLVYSKLMLHSDTIGSSLEFLPVVSKLLSLIENKEQLLPLDVLSGLNSIEKDGMSPIGFMFIYQARNVTKIEDLKVLFNFLNNIPAEIRTSLLSPFRHNDFDIDMLITGPWLKEHEQKTIKSKAHSEVFSQLEEQAVIWEELDLAVSCCKFQAIILDEYGNDFGQALRVLDEGLVRYGQENPELIRAKSKVLYRQKDYAQSFELARLLNDENFALRDVDRAFWGRDSAICAENLGDHKSAREFYLLARKAAEKCNTLDMNAMSVGLLADAALASWKSGDRLECLQDFVAVLSELGQFSSSASLRAAHCHNVARHVLLWLEGQATGDAKVLEDGAEVSIYPGCVSNPDPHAEIIKRAVLPIDLAWYMLAVIENCAGLNAGITDHLDRFLPQGPVLEGHILLANATMHRAILEVDARLFCAALRNTVNYFTTVKASKDPSDLLNFEKLTPGVFPNVSKIQQESLQELSEKFLLLFAASSVLQGNLPDFPERIKEVRSAEGFSIRPVVFERLQKGGDAHDFQTSFAQLIHSESSHYNDPPTTSPRQAFEFALKVFELAGSSQNSIKFMQRLFNWLQRRWLYVWAHQRFLLVNPSLHEANVEAAFRDNDATVLKKNARILLAILPTLSVGNENEIKDILLRSA